MSQWEEFCQEYRVVIIILLIASASACIAGMFITKS